MSLWPFSSRVEQTPPSVPPPPSPTTPQIITPYTPYRQQIDIYTKRCISISDEVKTTNNVSRVIFSHRYNFWGFNPGISYKINGKESGDSKNNTALFIGIILTLGTIFIFGTLWRGYKIASNNLNETQKIKDIFDVCEKKQDDTYLNAHLNKLLEKQLKIDTEILQKQKNYLGSTVLVLTGGISLAIGGLASIPLLITAGIITAIIGGAITLSNVGYFSWKNENLAKEYDSVNSLAKEIQEIFETYKTAFQDA